MNTTPMNRFNYLKSLQQDRTITFCQSYCENGICVNEDCKAYKSKSKCMLINKPTKVKMVINKSLRKLFGDPYNKEPKDK